MAASKPTALEGVRGLFNKAFREGHESESWRPRFSHRIFYHGTLIELLAQQGLVEQLYEWLDADRDYQYDYEELSVLVVNKQLDAGNPQHVALVKEYWEDWHVLAR